MAKWTTEMIPDQSGRIAVITGANSGLGFETALALAAKAAHVVMACRSMGKAEQAAEDIRHQIPDTSVEVMALDLGNLDSIHRFVEAYTAKYDRLDILINNAGVMHLPERQTADGFEMHFGINHLGHFALTGLLLPVLERTEDSRIVTVSSGLHRQGKMHFNDIHMRENYDKYAAYAQSKLANLLFAFELQRRLEVAGSHVLSVAAHPGYAATNLQYAGPEMEGATIRKLVMKVANTLIAQSQEQGALPQLYAAVAPDVNGCDYIGPDGLGEWRGYPTKVGCSDAAKSERDAAQLWELSAQETGVAFPFEKENAPA